MRKETDSLGVRELPADAYHGIHTLRALENFPLSGQKLPRVFIRALGLVKEACARTNLQYGYLETETAEAIIRACRELAEGALDAHILVDAFQGGAGTSANMNCNEVIANRAIELLGGTKGDYTLVHPFHHVNKHQSTNDVFPTALRVACLLELKDLETVAASLQEALQLKEDAFKDVLKVGRTQLMDAVPVTLGMEFGAFAEAVARDRWRVFKCRERIKQVNLGGTAVGTGLGAPRDFIFRATERLKELTGLALARAENLVDATQNLDAFVEVSGMLKAFAVNLVKIGNDLRLLASGPYAGLGEIELEPLQAGSSIMAGKINPVIPEAVVQAGLKIMGNDTTIATAASLGQLELNHLLPLIAHDILESLALLKNSVRIFDTRCIRTLRPRTERCAELVAQSRALATVLVPVIGYEQVQQYLKESDATAVPLADLLVERGIASRTRIEELLSPKRMRKLGFTDGDYAGITPESSKQDNTKDK